MDFVVILGPPAVGKMAVGLELARLTGFRLFHNHASIDPLLSVFEFGSPEFWRVVHDFRMIVFSAAAGSQ